MEYKIRRQIINFIEKEQEELLRTEVHFDRNYYVIKFSIRFDLISKVFIIAIMLPMNVITKKLIC